MLQELLQPLEVPGDDPGVVLEKTRQGAMGWVGMGGIAPDLAAALVQIVLDLLRQGSLRAGVGAKPWHNLS